MLVTWGLGNESNLSPPFVSNLVFR